MDEQMNLFDMPAESGFRVIQGSLGKENDKEKTKENDKLKCFKSELKDITSWSLEELFYGFNTIKAITFSYDIAFIEKIMDYFNYGEIILGADFLVQKDTKLNEFLAEVYTNAYEAGQAVRKHNRLSQMVSEGSLIFHTPTFVMDHRKIYMLQADDGRTRVIKTSANMSGRAWNGSQMEFYDFDDSRYCYDEYAKDFETAWLNSEEVPMSVISSKKADDLVEGNAILKGVKETGRTIVLQQPEDTVSFDKIKYAIDHAAIKEKYKEVLDGLNTKGKKGFFEIVPKTIEKIEHNQRKMMQKKMKVNHKTENYPSMSFDFYNMEAAMNDLPLNLHPSEEEVRSDIDKLFGIFDNFDSFVGDTKALKETHFKLLNAIFSSPFNAKLRCTALVRGIGTSSLPLFLLAASHTANSGKTFMVRTALKMMTGKDLPELRAGDCKKDDIRNMQVGCKCVPVFIDEFDNTHQSRIKDIIINPERCEENQLEEQPMLVFASNAVTEADEIMRKRMVFLRFNAALPSTVDQSAYKSRGNAIIKKLGNGFYREYLRRIISKVADQLDYMVHAKDIPDEYYPDMMAVSSDVILSIFEDYGYEIPFYARHLTWNDDYSVNAKFISDNAIEEIRGLYKRNKKAFTFTNDTVTIELGSDKDSVQKGKSWKNTLPPEMKAVFASNSDYGRITIDRKELEARLGMKLGGVSLFRKR